MNRTAKGSVSPLRRALRFVPVAAMIGAMTPLAAAANDGGCHLRSVHGDIKHVIYIQFDNTHLTRDNPNVPSDLEQMPHLLNFVKNISLGRVMNHFHFFKNYIPFLVHFIFVKQGIFHHV